MARAEVIEHTGIVHEVDNNCIKVRIAVQSACSSCKAHSFCGVDTSEKLIEVEHWVGEYNKGEAVMLSLQQSLGYRALFWGYILPFFLVISVIISMIFLTGNEALSGLVSLLVLVPYYAILYFFRDRFKKTFSFKISKLLN